MAGYDCTTHMEISFTAGMCVIGGEVDHMHGTRITVQDSHGLFPPVELTPEQLEAFIGKKAMDEIWSEWEADARIQHRSVA